MQRKPKVAVIGTGGTITSIGVGPFDIVDYVANATMLHADALIAKFPEVQDLADIVGVPFKAVPSPNIWFPDWKEIVLTCDRLVSEHADLAGIVVLHGTGSIEETAYVLGLTLKIDLPVVVVGSQRPASALSSDAGMNLANAIRTAASPDARGMGVLVLLNDEIHAAREVTKTSTFRLQTFRSPDFGVLGHADGDAVAFYRRPIRKTAPDTIFDIRQLDALPRVDITYSYTGSDGAAVKAFAAAGARGIISAGFAPGMSSPDEFEALKAAREQGIVVMQCTRAGSGRMFKGKRLREAGFLVTDNLNPQKARLLLALALTITSDTDAIEDMFLTY